MNVALRKAISEAGYTITGLAKEIRVDSKTVSRWVNGTRVPQPRHRRACADALGAEEKALWPDAGRRRAPEWVRQWLMAEREATALRCWHPSAVPGLFQTEEYARAMLRVGTLTATEVDIALASRLGRQAHVLERRNPPSVVCIIDEVAFLRGERAMIRRQAEHLLRLGERDEVRIRVLPLGEGLHPGQHGPFALASLPGGATVGYAEGPADGRTTHDVAAMESHWDTLGTAALPRGATRTFLEGLHG